MAWAVSYRRGLGSVPGLTMWGLWLTNSTEVGFSQGTVVFPSHSFYQCFTLIHSFIHSVIHQSPMLFNLNNY